ASLANEDVGFVEVGQPARIKLVTYPFQKYGLLDARVTQISADALEASEKISNSGVPLAYRALLELATQRLMAADGTELDLAAGMAATMEMDKGRRRVREFVLSRVQGIVREGGRER